MGAEDDSRRVFRVTVRGRFHDLTPAAHGYLTSAVAEHDIFVSAYTPEGTFTYDERIDFFNLRYEIRPNGANAGEQAAADGLAEAGLFLRTLGYGFRDLKVNVVDMATMWTPPSAPFPPSPPAPSPPKSA